jgi:hypothetical protein
MNLDQDTAQKILAADFTNIMKKVKAGKPLTPAERKLVAQKTAADETPNAPAEPPEKNAAADRYGGAANKLGIALNMDGAAARTNLGRDKVKLARDRGCTAFHASGRVDCDALLDFVANNAQLFATDDDKPNLDLEEALTARVNRKIREEKLLEIRKRVIARVEVGQRLKALSLAQKAILEKELKDNPALAARICALMRPLVAEWSEPGEVG